MANRFTFYSRCLVTLPRRPTTQQSNELLVTRVRTTTHSSNPRDVPLQLLSSSNRNAHSTRTNDESTSTEIIVIMDDMEHTTLLITDTSNLTACLSTGNLILVEIMPKNQIQLGCHKLLFYSLFTSTCRTTTHCSTVIHWQLHSILLNSLPDIIPPPNWTNEK